MPSVLWRTTCCPNHQCQRLLTRSSVAYMIIANLAYVAVPVAEHSKQSSLHGNKVGVMLTNTFLSYYPGASMINIYMIHTDICMVYPTNINTVVLKSPSNLFSYTETKNLMMERFGEKNARHFSKECLFQRHPRLPPAVSPTSATTNVFRECSNINDA